MTTYYLLIAALLLLLGIFSSKLSEKFGIPALILFLGIGMLAGSDGPGGIYFNNAGMAKLFGTIALIYILFSGAIETDWVSVRPVLARGILLSSVGVFITAIAVGLFARLILHFSITEGLLLGAIVSSTDAAAVFTVLRSRNIGLKGNLKQLLELESGSNDPMAVFLTVALIQYMGNAELKATQMAMSFVISMSCGAVLGLAMGKLTSLVLNKIHLDYEGLYPVLSITIVLLVYSLTEILKGNGFLAVYIFGIVLGNSDFLYKRSLIRFHNGLAWLMQITMFIVLGLLVFPKQLTGIIGPGLLISIFLILVARPLAVFICLFRSNFTFNEKTLAAWAGLRGAVPIVLATFPLMVGNRDSNKIFNIVFFIVLTSVLLQGKLLLPLARWLNVYHPVKHRPRYPLEFDKTEDVDTQTREYDIHPESPIVGKEISEIHLPHETLILLIRREKRFIVPKGHTRLQAHDTLLVIAKQEDLHKTRNILRGT
jgi:potassium/hydrogen antiporter